MGVIMLSCGAGEEEWPGAAKVRPRVGGCGSHGPRIDSL